MLVVESVGNLSEVFVVTRNKSGRSGRTVGVLPSIVRRDRGIGGRSLTQRCRI
jgi:hypothetical protein